MKQPFYLPLRLVVSKIGNWSGSCIGADKRVLASLDVAISRKARSLFRLSTVLLCVVYNGPCTKFQRSTCRRSATIRDFRTLDQVAIVPFHPRSSHIYVFDITNV